MTEGAHTWPCTLCDQELVIRSTKNGKPYLLCEDCGIQIFFRSQKSIDLLEKKLKQRKGSTNA
jgi:DNA-directed RNA polymerase subunit RPC12/RpoP